MSKAVKSVVGIVAGVAIGAFTGGIGLAVLGGVLGGLVGQMAGGMEVKSPNIASGPSSQTVRSSKAAARFILGRASTGGVFSFIQEQNGSESNGEWLHLVYVLSDGAIDGVEGIYLNEEPIASYGANATHEVVINPTQVNAFLKANCPGWRDEMIGRGLSYVRISIKFDQAKFPSGIPQARFVVRGRNDLFDPRTGTTGYSANSALAILWYLRNRCGVPDDEIIFESFASAANVCSESVGNADGSSSSRYLLGAVIGADEKKTDVLKKLTDTCAGNLLRIGGRWSLQVGAYYGPADFEITEDMIIGTVEGTTEVSNDDAVNVIRGTFIDPAQAWAETDYPEVMMADWVAQDGGESSDSMSFPYVTDAYQAQRLANIELRRRRAAGSLSLPMNFAGYNCRPGRVVRVNLPSLNINAEVIVSNWQMGAQDACSVSVKPYDALFFDDAVGEPYEPLGFIDLPAGGMAAPTNLQWSVETDAEVSQGVLSWVSPSVMVDYFKVTVRQAGAVVQALTVPAPASRCNISALDSGVYTIGVAAKGPMALSGETTLQVDIDGPPVPESCVVIAGNLEITLVPSNILKRLNGGTYEYFYALRADIPPAQADYLGQGLSFTHTGLSYNTQYFYYVRSVNAYGRSGFLAVPAITSSDVSGLLDALTGQIEGTQLGQDLGAEIDKISGDGPGSVNQRINEAIAEVSDALAYNSETAYAEGDTVRGGPNGRRLYQALAAVPAAPDGSNAPPNPLLWLDIGQVVEEAGGIVTELNLTKARVETVGGKVTAQGESISALRAETRPKRADGEKADALRGWETQASYAQSVRVQATDREASVARDTQLSASVGDANARITAEELVRASADSALALRSERIEARMPAGEGAVASSASVEVIAQAQADQGDKLGAMWSVKLQVGQGGQYEFAGIGLGIENVGGVLQSQFLVRAGRFAVLDDAGGGLVSPFVVQGGQTIINSAVIGNASISWLKIGDDVYSTNYVAGISGWRLQKNGNFEINGSTPGQGRTLINNEGVKVYDAAGVLRVKLGKL